MTKRRSISLLLTASLAAGMITALTPSSAMACAANLTRHDVFRQMRSGETVGTDANGAETFSFRTLNIDFEADKKTYRRGDIAVITAMITRPAKEDPLNNGIPMDRPYVEPAEGVTVGVGLHVGRVFLPGAAITDAEGKAVIRIKIESYAPVNKWIDASLYSWKIVAPGRVLHSARGWVHHRSAPGPHGPLTATHSSCSGSTSSTSPSVAFTSTRAPAAMPISIVRARHNVPFVRTVPSGAMSV